MNNKDVLPLACRDVSLRRNGRLLLDNVCISFDGAATTAVLGPNGSGKTLLLRVLAGLQAPDRGTVSWAGRPPDRARTPRLGFIFQKPVLLRRSVLANVRYALAAAGSRGHTATEKAYQALEWAGLSTLAGSPARALSGGEQQRLAIARVAATEPEILFLDEPASALDLRSIAMIEALVRSVAARGTKVVLVTHDTAQAARLADDVIFLDQGRVQERRSVAAFFEKPDSAAARDFLAGRIPSATEVSEEMER